MPVSATDADSCAIQNEDSRHGEECLACGDVGRLLCCDGVGCVNSFHGDCLEPPVDPDDPTLDLWYCPECEKRQRPYEAQGDNQLMGPLINQVLTAPPRAYSLPLGIRNYFEHVKTGDDGEYVETAPPPTNKKGALKADHHGALKPPNFKELKDSKGNTRFCYKCNGTTDGGRDIIPCDFCPNEWHLDCLDPPLATLPRRADANGKPIQNWRCPLHIDQDLKNISLAQHAAPGQMGRRPRLRWPKKRILTTPKEFLAQNPTNNGLIEPGLEPEELELDFKTVEMNGAVMKIPEQQIKLDFIAKARYEFYMDVAVPRHHGNEPARFHSKAWTPDNAQYRGQQSTVVAKSQQSRLRPTPTIDLNARNQADAEQRLQRKSFVEQQTVLALLDLMPRNDKPDGDEKITDSQSSVGDLVKQLVADAPDQVAEQINLSEVEQLERLMELAQQRLSIVKGQSKQQVADIANDQNTKNPLKNKINGETIQPQVNGRTLGHDHGDD